MIKLFISYAHKDESLVSKFFTHIAPLKNSKKIDEWYDRKLIIGEEFQNDIDSNLENADIICLMISDNFLASKPCMDEKDTALTLRRKKGIRVIPIIVSPCAWTIQKELSELLASPTDGKPITSFADPNVAWLDVVKWLNKVCDSIRLIKSLKIRDEFSSFLISAEILTKSHKNKETLILQDIFVYPKLKSYDSEENSHRHDAERLMQDILTYKKIIIAGESQSGKTTLCKILFTIYRQLNYVPIYLEDEHKYLGNPNIKLQKAYKEQYENGRLEDFEPKRIVPIIDNFHSAKHQEKYIDQFANYTNQVLIVDDIFGLSIKNQLQIKEYSKFKIREFSALERNELIKKWIQIKEVGQIESNPNYFQQSVDEKTELIESSLGIIFGKGIMPSYAFFILSVLAAQDTQKPLDSEITSQGHCYQALIYLYLRNQGVKNNQIDIYTNFLMEVANEIYRNGGNSLDNGEFDKFLDDYKVNFNLPISSHEILLTLSKVNICKFNSLNQFNFCYSYIYYFFVAKYLSEHIDSKKKIINSILSNLHKDENAYITVFIAHHTKSNYLLDELLLNAEILFEKFQPAVLDNEELSFFDKHEEKIIKAILPSFDHNANEERQRLLEEKADLEENIEQANKPSQAESDFDQATTEFASNLRLSIKTVEVMGLIIKNRSGSLDKLRLEYIYEQGLKVHLRILKSFIELIKDEGAESDIVAFLRERINQTIEEQDDREFTIEEIEKIARSIYWNMNFGVLHGFVTKAIHSLGSSNLFNVSQAVSDRLKTPSAFIVNQGVRMWYGKNLRIDEIAERISERDFSKTAVNLIKLKVVEHCRLHNIEFKDLLEIESKLKIPSAKMLMEKSRNGES